MWHRVKLHGGVAWGVLRRVGVAQERLNGGCCMEGFAWGGGLHGGLFPAMVGKFH